MDAVWCTVIHLPGWVLLEMCAPRLHSLRLSRLPPSSNTHHTQTHFSPFSSTALWLSLSDFSPPLDLSLLYGVYQSLSLQDKSSSRTLTCSSCTQSVRSATLSPPLIHSQSCPYLSPSLLSSSPQEAGYFFFFFGGFSTWTKLEVLT